MSEIRRSLMNLASGGGGGDQPIGENLIVWSGRTEGGKPLSDIIPILEGASYVLNITTKNYTDTRNVRFLDEQYTILKSWKPTNGPEYNIDINSAMPEGAVYMEAITYAGFKDTMEIIRVS